MKKIFTYCFSRLTKVFSSTPVKANDAKGFESLWLGPTLTRNLLTAVGLIAMSNFTMAQLPRDSQLKDQKKFTLGVIDEISSRELNERRTLNIYFPENYSPDSAMTYPVIYLLDGSANEDFVHICGLVQFLTMIEVMPKSIVVGIANVDRRRDFTFPTTIVKDKTDYPTTGSSQKFIGFLKNELQPFVKKKYKVNGKSTIIGQSLGGLLATEILLKDKELFDNYIIVSPSLWWDNESLLSFKPATIQKQTSKPTQVYISVGTEGKQMEEDAMKLGEMLKASGNENLRVMYEPLPAENHLTILHNSVYKGLGLLYTHKQL